MSEAEKRDFYTSARAKGLNPDWPVRPDKLFSREQKLKGFFPNLVAESKIVYALDIFPDAIKPYIGRLPPEEMVSKAKQMVSKAKEMKEMVESAKRGS